MADTLIEIKSGFYDAIDNDRTYYADDMNRPYKRVISNGVFANPAGTPSNDFQVFANGGMQITIKAGEGLFGNKWTQNSTDQIMTVQSNTSHYLRIDSIIVQVDLTRSGRKASIVYRTGVPSQSQDAAAPSINLYTDIVEYRIANIYVYQNVSEILQENISDTRGSAECPWVTSLITQPDTSTLWNRYNDAFANKLDEMGRTFDGYLGRVEDAWHQFFDNLTSELTLETNITTLSSLYIASGETTTVPINIASYDSSTDVLTVYINGMMAQGMYTVSGTNIVLTNAIPSGTKVLIFVFKGIITSDMSTVPQMLQRIENMVAAATEDTGRITLPLTNGEAFSSVEKPVYRKVGKVVYITGAVKNYQNGQGSIGELPVSMLPPTVHYYTTLPYDPATGTSGSPVLLSINSSGLLGVVAGTVEPSYKIPLDTAYVQ